MSLSKDWYTQPLVMSIGEITHEFRNAKYPADMIKVLADLNSTQPSRIRWILRQCGLMVDGRGAKTSKECDSAWMAMDGAECASIKKILMESGVEIMEEQKVTREIPCTREGVGDYIVSMLWDVYLNRRGMVAVTPEMVTDMRELMKLADLAADIVEVKKDV